MSRPGAGPAVAVAPPGRLALALRLPVLVAVTGALGLAGHVLADREVPPPRLLALGLAVVALGVLPLRRREAGPALLAGALLGGQAALHLVLCLCHCAPGSPVGDVVHRVLCPQDAPAWAGDPLLVVPTHAPSGYLAHAYPGHAMLLAHLAAALAAAWWLRRGEAAAHAALRSWLPAPSRPPAAPRVVLPALAHAPADRPVRVLADQVRLLARPRRGPPVVVRPG